MKRLPRRVYMEPRVPMQEHLYWLETVEDWLHLWDRQMLVMILARFWSN
jgi:hypothetical protein